MTWGKYRSIDSLEVWRRFPALLQLTGQPGEEGSANGCTDNLGFIHPSLQEILQSHAIRGGPLSIFAIDWKKAKEEVAIRCVSHLLGYKSRGSYTSKRGWNAYAGLYWHQQIKIQSSTANKGLTAQCIKLLDHQTPSFRHWTYMSRRYGDIDASEAGDFAINATYPSPIYYAALLDLYECAVTLYKDGADANIEGGKHKYPIVAAVVAGAERIVHFLAIAENSAEPKKVATLKAVVLGRSQILKNLLELGADIHVSYREDLQDATQPGCWRRMRVLYRLPALPRVDIEARDNKLMSPLLTAAEYGQEKALALLLQKGAKVDVCTKAGTTALYCALANLNLPMLGNGPYSSPLHMAMDANLSELGVHHLRLRAVVEILLEYGADPSIPDADGRLAEDKTSDPDLRELFFGRWIDVVSSEEDTG
ncbi:MAG: hypothetical protein Q9198_000867 [Flavoplaca austrocitrina]